MADITIIRNGARISLASFPKLGSGSENIAVAVSTSGAYDTYTTELYYGWYQGSSMQKALAKYQNGLYYIPSNALFNAGNVYLTLRLVSGDSKVSTNTIPITIEKSAVNNEYSILPASETWQNAVDNYINNSINLLNERIDNLEVDGRNIENEITAVNTKMENKLSNCDLILDTSFSASGTINIPTSKTYSFYTIILKGDDNNGITFTIPKYVMDNYYSPFYLDVLDLISTGYSAKVNGLVYNNNIEVRSVSLVGWTHIAVNVFGVY